MTTSRGLATKNRNSRSRPAGEKLCLYAERPELPTPSTKIQGLLFEHIGICHEDSRRSLLAVFNGTFKAEQARLAVARRACLLGGHYHDSAELFFVIIGIALFTVEAVDPPHVREFYTLQAGDALRVPARIAHLAQVTSGTILETFTERQYTTPADYDHIYPPLRCMTEAGLPSAYRLYKRTFSATLPTMHTREQVSRPRGENEQ
jgi:mannose-6-phosphate isomerase-like protein (cupin superfamily)